MKPYDHPIFSEFKSAFEELVRLKAGSLKSNFNADGGLSAAPSPIDPLIHMLMSRDPRIVKHCLNTAANNTLKADLPSNNLGDAFVAFYKFVLTHRRLPRWGYLLSDALYHLKISGELSNPMRVFITDKEYVKRYVSSVTSDHFNVSTIAILRSESEVDAFIFPAGCAVKPTNQSGPKLFPVGNAPIDKKEVGSWFQNNYYLTSREANYKPLRTKIIVEELLVGFYEVKVFVVFGKPRFIQIVFQHDDLRTVDHFTDKFERIPITSVTFPPSNTPIVRPHLLEEILDLSIQLAKKLNLVRIDFYTNDKVIKVGEITNCHMSGLAVFREANGEELLSKAAFAGHVEAD